MSLHTVWLQLLYSKSQYILYRLPMYNLLSQLLCMIFTLFFCVLSSTAYPRLCTSSHWLCFSHEVWFCSFYVLCQYVFVFITQYKVIGFPYIVSGQLVPKDISTSRQLARPQKNEAPCHSRYGVIKISPCLMAIRAELRPKFCRSSLTMVTFPYKWRILERYVKQYVISHIFSSCTFVVIDCVPQRHLLWVFISNLVGWLETFFKIYNVLMYSFHIWITYLFCP